MSWQPWIDPLLVIDEDGNVCIKDAAICCFLEGQESIWAATDGLKNITPAEIKRIRTGGNDLFQSGPYVAGQKCQVIRNSLDTEERSMSLKTNIGADGESYFIAIGKSNQCYIIAKGTKGAPSGKINLKVDKLRKQLMDSNY